MKNARHISPRAASQHAPGDAPSDGLAAKAAGMRSVGVLWGANSEEVMRECGAFDEIVADVPALTLALRGILL